MSIVDKSFESLDSKDQELQKICRENYESARKARIYVENTETNLKELDRIFEAKTSLNSTDFKFMMMAVGLQIARQYLFEQITLPLDRPSDREAADNTYGHDKEHSNRQHRYYNPSLEEIITNPVPFDAIAGSNGVLSGGGSRGHRVKTLGHDPVVGLVIGTANIATATLTTNKLETYHVVTHNKRDTFGNKAKTSLMLKKTVDKLLYEGYTGRSKAGAAFIKEIIHLRSDINSKHSLALPFISMVDPKLASKLAEYGFDMCNVVAVSRHMVYAQLINMIISMAHFMCYDENEMAPNVYQVKTRKIIGYSNIIASASNLLYTFITKDIRKLDIGGLLVTILTLLRNRDFIYKVKEEFILGEFKKKLMEY